MTDPADQAHEAWQQARAAYAAKVRAYQAALDAVRAAWAKTMHDADATEKSRKLDYDRVVAATASHPWVGKKVTKTVPGMRGTHWSSPTPDKVFTGIVGIMGPDVSWGGSKWDIPEAGEPFVQLTNSNGKLGKKHMKLKEFTIGPGDGVKWKLVEE